MNILCTIFFVSIVNQILQPVELDQKQIFMIKYFLCHSPMNALLLPYVRPDIH